MFVEPDEERETRRRRRLTFDAVADLYQSTRRGYPSELLEQIVATAGVGDGSQVLEVGCGTGQLTRQLIAHGVALTAIDISRSMVDAARKSAGKSARFEAVAFEDFTPRDETFDLVISATAFHWIDPNVGFAKAAELLRPGGWLALLGTGEHYDEPFGTALRNVWGALQDPTAVAPSRPSEAELIAATSMFGPAMSQSHEERLTLPAGVIAGLERTRATVLDYTPELRQRYDEALDALLAPLAEVPLTQRTSLTMAQRLQRPS